MIKRIIWICIVTLIVVGCRGNELAKKSNMSPEILFETKYAFIEKEDGWVQYLAHEYIENEEGTDYYNFEYNGINLKYKQLDQYKIEMIDGATGEVLDSIDPSCAAYVLDSEYAADAKQVVDFLVEKRDLQGLSLQVIEKEEVKKLYMEVMASKALPTGNYLSLPYADIIQETEIYDGYRWQVGYIIMHGVITNIKIELLYENDGQIEYLSDRITGNIGTSEEEELFNSINKYEKAIINTQELIPKNISLSDSGVIDNNRLYSLLEGLGKD